jgi:hypothetical protein
LGEGEGHQDGQDDPLVAIAKGGVVLAAANGVAVTPLAVDVFAAMFVHGIVADQTNAFLGPEMP